jgi:hypothetical protein
MHDGGLDFDMGGHSSRWGMHIFETSRMLVPLECTARTARTVLRLFNSPTICVTQKCDPLTLKLMSRSLFASSLLSGLSVIVLLSPFV